jgi:hypothetical protein
VSVIDAIGAIKVGDEVEVVGGITGVGMHGCGIWPFGGIRVVCELTVGAAGEPSPRGRMVVDSAGVVCGVAGVCADAAEAHAMTTEQILTLRKMRTIMELSSVGVQGNVARRRPCGPRPNRKTDYCSKTFSRPV